MSMNPLFSASVYQKRREKLMQIMTAGYALFLGNDEASMNYPSNTYKYRQHSTFLYFFGLSLPNMGAIIDFDHKKTILFGDDFEIDELGLMILTNDKDLYNEYQSNETKIKSVFIFLFP